MSSAQNSQHPFRIPFSFGDGFLGRVSALLIKPLAAIVCLKQLNETYARMPERERTLDFFTYALDAMKMDIQVEEHELARIPREGPFILVANHPFGMIESLLLGKMLTNIRPDFKILGNYMMNMIPEIREFNIAVDPYGGKEAASHNISPLRDALRHLKHGGCLMTFPAGEVAHLDLRRRTITDSAWDENIAGIIRRTHVPVLPVFFTGGNSWLFYALGVINPWLRTLMLPRELLKKQQTCFPIKVGQAISPERLAAISTNEELISYVRMRTYLLNPTCRQSRPIDKNRTLVLKRRQKPIILEPLAPAEPVELLRKEIARLSADETYYASGEFQVIISTAQRIPHLLREIGRQREMTFRDAGEGSGKALDLDKYDEYYLHLFLWHKEKEEVVGAYRLGLSDEILQQYGTKGLYTSSLFQYDASLIQNIGSALELGRSFVRPEYQRTFSALMLLWKGIGTFIAKHPKYRYLFGPVSISNEYTTLSRQLMVAFLQANHLLPDLAKQVKPRQPLKMMMSTETSPRQCASCLSDLDDLARLINELECGEKGIPILLKQYLKLGGHLLGFNVDSDFSDVVDGLILVDLLKTEQRVLEKYLGVDGLAQFYAYYNEPTVRKTQELLITRVAG